VRTYEPKLFVTFENECQQAMEIKKHIAFTGGHDKGDKHGQGTELTEAGDFYQGGWQKGLRHGSGICFYADGTVYKGGWFEGKWTPGPTFGMTKTPAGEILLGQFTGERGSLKDMTHCQIKYLSGDVYSGLTYRGKKQARGTYYYSNGDVYEGEWEENHRSGKGQLTLKNGSHCKGEFLEDAFVSGLFTDVNGNLYRNVPDHTEKPGVFRNGRLFGWGKVNFTDGGAYEGEFKDGKRSGHGVMKQVIGSDGREEIGEYRGQWRYNLRHGRGDMVWTSD